MVVNHQILSLSCVGFFQISDTSKHDNEPCWFPWIAKKIFEHLTYNDSSCEIIKEKTIEKFEVNMLVYSKKKYLFLWSAPKRQKLCCFSLSGCKGIPTKCMQKCRRSYCTYHTLESTALVHRSAVYKLCCVNSKCEEVCLFKMIIV